jgi:hypothetical protein
MAALSDQQQLADDQRVEIKLDAEASLKLLTFLQVHRERLNRQAREE